jgi:hypothetical protein
VTAAHDHLLCESCCTGRPPLDKGPSGFIVATLCDAGNGLAIRGLTHPERTQGGSEAQEFFAQKWRYRHRLEPIPMHDLQSHPTYWDGDRTCTAEPCLPSHVLEVEMARGAIDPCLGA